MAAVRFTQRAREDLLGIWLHIAQNTGVHAADRIYDLIQEGCEALRTHPRIGRARPEIADEARAIVIDRWLAFYRLVDSGVQIVRVVDGVRDLRAMEWTIE